MKSHAVGKADGATVRALSAYRRVSRQAATFGLVLLIAFFTVTAWYSVRADSLLGTGHSTDAVVTSVHPGVTRSGSFQVAYRVGGHDYDQTICCDYGSYDIGQHVTVIYSPSDPSRVRTRADDNSGPWPSVTGLLLAGAGYGLVAGGVGLRRARRLARILAQADWEPAWVTRGGFRSMTGRTKLFLTPAGADGAGLEVTVAGTTRARTRFLRAIRTTPGHGVLVCTGPLAEVALSPPDRSVLVLGRRTL